MIDNVFHHGSTSIRVAHDCCTEPTGRTKDGLLVRSKSQRSDTLTTITVEKPDKPRRIYVFWPSDGTSQHFELLYIPATQTLFVGGGAYSAAIDIDAMSVIRQNEIMLFEGFQRHGQFVLELGELDCSLYDLHATLIDRTPVDPPYEIIKTDRGINLVSTMGHSSSLIFPK